MGRLGRKRSESQVPPTGSESLCHTLHSCSLDSVQPVTLSCACRRTPGTLSSLSLRKKPGNTSGSEKVVKTACFAFFSPLFSHVPVPSNPTVAAEELLWSPQQPTAQGKETSSPTKEAVVSRGWGKIPLLFLFLCSPALPQYVGTVAGMCGRMG